MVVWLGVGVLVLMLYDDVCVLLCVCLIVMMCDCCLCVFDGLVWMVL